jgi:hypothetical protein
MIMWTPLEQHNTWGKFSNGWLGSAPLALHQTTSPKHVFAHQGASQKGTILDVHVSHPSLEQLLTCLSCLSPLQLLLCLGSLSQLNS